LHSTAGVRKVKLVCVGVETFIVKIRRGEGGNNKEGRWGEWQRD
jgi:hypothetical protein